MLNDGARASAYGDEFARAGVPECVGEQWTVATRSPSNFGFAKLANLRTPVPHCEVRYTGGIAAALKTATPWPKNGTGGRT
jgi:hypothetical protein